MTKPPTKQPTCRVAPLPKLTWSGHAWEATVTVRAWAGFQARGGPYTSRSSRRPSTGRVRLSVAAPGGEPTQPPTREQAAAFAFLLANQDAIRDAVLPKLLREYRRARKQRIEDGDDDDEIDFDAWLDQDDPDAPMAWVSRALPDLKTPAALREVMGLGIVHILAAARGGVAFVGLEFGCDWDDEHGAGAMLHRARVMKVGAADTSFLTWIATRAGGKPLVAAPPAAAPLDAARRATSKPPRTTRTTKPKATARRRTVRAR